MYDVRGQGHNLVCGGCYYGHLLGHSGGLAMFSLFVWVMVTL